MKLVDLGDSKSPAARRAGSSPALGTRYMKKALIDSVLFLFPDYFQTNYPQLKNLGYPYFVIEISYKLLIKIFAGVLKSLILAKLSGSSNLLKMNKLTLPALHNKSSENSDINRPPLTGLCPDAT